jgi:outer membrane immunogenic protein
MKIVLALAASAVMATQAFAGGPVVVAYDPVVVAPPAPAPQAMDWSGFYGGLGYGSSSGDIDFTPAPARALDSGNAASVFAGYLWQRDNFVFGGELAYTSLKDNVVTGFPTFELKNSIDLKGRLGLAANRMLFYGVVGYSMASYDEGAGDWDPSGMSYGLGVDYQVSNRMTLGLEYLARDLSGDNPDGLGLQEVDVKLDTLSLRVGFQF